ncbi:MAG: hypothetical protein Q7S52_04795, partial [bacterium]|nr:hypothetical protein [bacterium]
HKNKKRSDYVFVGCRMKLRRHKKSQTVLVSTTKRRLCFCRMPHEIAAPQEAERPSTARRSIGT